MRAAFLGFLLAGVLLPADARADSTVFLAFDGYCLPATPTCPPPRIVRANAETHAIERTYPLACAPYSLRVTAGGRYLVWVEICGPAPAVRLFDLVGEALVPLGNVPATAALHPAELRLLWAAGDTIASLTPAGVSSVPTSECTDAAFTLSGDGLRLAQGCGTTGIAVRETATGRGLRRFSPAQIGYSQYDWQLGVTGSDLYVSAFTPFGFYAFQRFDVSTGVRLANRDIAQPFEGSLSWARDPRTGRHFIGHASSMDAYDPVALQPLGGVQTGGAGLGAFIAFDPGGARAYVWPSFGNELTVMDTERLAVLARLTLAAPDRLMNIAVTSSRPTPIALTATVSGQAVTLAWQPGPGLPPATRFALEAGLSPGTSNIARLAIDGTTLSVPAVPPGTYFVRVCALAGGDESSPSAEIAVTVP